MDPNLCYMRMTSSFTGLSILQMTLLCCSHNVNTLGAWSSIKLLKFNPSKCKTMFISRRRLRRSEPSPLFLNGSLIEAVDCIKYLGISIASDLSWSQHIQSITSKARRLVGLLFRQYYHYADTNVLKKLYVSLVRPHLEYAVPIWDPYIQPRIVISLRVCKDLLAGCA